MDVLKHLNLKLKIIKNNKLMLSHIDDDKLLKKNKIIWTKIEGFLKIGLDALLVFNGRFLKIRVRTYYGKVYTNFCSLNVSDYGAECESFAVISIDFLLIYHNKFYLQVYLNNCAYKIIGKQMIDYLDDSAFETDEG